MPCKFDKAWIGPCGAETNGGPFCPKHAKLVCCSCGSPAVRECDHTGIQVVCGMPLCGKCRHGIPGDGQYGFLAMGGGHVTEEVYREQCEKKYGPTT